MKEALQDGSWEWITLLACICADGSALPPELIYEAAAGAIQSDWVEDIDAKKRTAFVDSSTSGWTNNDLGLAWLEQVFDRYTRRKARRSYRLLVIDGHGSHLTMDFLNYCDQNQILLAVFPLHSTHRLQPLDVVLFKPLLTAYSTELTAYLHNSQGLLPIKKGTSSLCSGRHGRARSRRQYWSHLKQLVSYLSTLIWNLTASPMSSSHRKTQLQ